ncbi:MAG: methyl-accepting chemotaxis protein [Ectothiorhodospiraceae bacterium]
MPSARTADLTALYVRADRISVGIIWLTTAVTLALAVWSGTWQAWGFVALPAAALPSLLVALNPGARINRVTVAAAYMVLIGVAIHQAGGMVEMHFGIFCLLAFLLVYRDWLPVVAGAGVTAIHHVGFNALQTGGTGVYLFPEPSWGMVAVHAAFVVFQTSVLVFLAETARRDALAGVELDTVARGLKGDNGIDLTYRLSNPRSAVTQGLHGTLDGIRETLASARATLTEVTSVGEAVSSHSGSIAERASEQSGETQNVASSVTEMSASIQEVARNASETATTTRRFSERLQGVQTQVEEASQLIASVYQRLEQGSAAIESLEQAGERIGSVVDVIRNVTDRTHLLALNASIEAARAGDQGRGFAVVAEEVRNLAQQTAQSTQEIESMISALRDQTRSSVADMRAGVEETGQGARGASEASERMQALRHEISHLDDLTGGIASAAEEQSQVAEDIDRRLNAIRDRATTTENAAADSASQADTLRQQIETLAQRLERFSL